MIKPWVFEFTYSIDKPDEEIAPSDITAVYDDGLVMWQRVEELGFEGVFFSEHHFEHSYSASPNLLIASIAQRTSTLRLGVMGVVLPFYQPWRVVEEMAMLDHLTHGRLEIGVASGVPQELAKIGVGMEEGRGLFNEALDILDAALADPIISYHGKYWNFDDLTILPRFLQRPAPPKWTTVISRGSAEKSAARESKICTGFHSTDEVTAIFETYRAEADRLGKASGPEMFGLRRNVSIALDEQEARDRAALALETSKKVISGDSRAQENSKTTLDAPKSGKGFSLHEDEYIAGTPSQVVEQIIYQCRACGAGNFLAMFGRDSSKLESLDLFGNQVISELRRAEIG